MSKFFRIAEDAIGVAKNIAEQRNRIRQDEINKNYHLAQMGRQFDFEKLNREDLREKEKMKLEHQQAMRGYDVTSQGQDLAHQVGMRGHEVASEGNRFQRDVGMMGQNVAAMGHRFGRELGMANLAVQEKLGQLQRDSSLETAIVNKLPELASSRTDQLGNVVPPPGLDAIQRTAGAVIQGVRPDARQELPQAASYSIDPAQAQATAASAFQVLGKKSGDIGKRVSALFDNPENFESNLDKMLKDKKLSKEEKLAIVDLAEIGLVLGGKEELTKVFTNILGGALR